MAYGTPQPSPTVALVALKGDAVVVTLTGLGDGSVEIRAVLGFEILGADKLWHVVAIQSSDASSVTVG